MSDEVSDSMNLSRMSNSVIINGYHFLYHATVLCLFKGTEQFIVHIEG